MTLHVSLAGHRCRWRFYGSHQLDELLDSTPWVNGGGVHLVRTASGYSEDLSVALQREIRGVDNGRWDVRILQVPQETLREGFVPGLFRLISSGKTPPSSWTERMSRVTDWVCNQPTVLLVGPAPEGKGESILHEAEELHDMCLAHNEERAVTVLAFDTLEEPAGEENVIDLSVGWPVDPTLSTHGAEGKRLWRAYLHARLAWETAGDLAAASEWSHSGFDEIGVGNDDWCEKLLNELALARFQRIDESRLTKLKEYVCEFVSKNRSSTRLEELAAELTMARLVWRPDGTRWPLPVPWAARRLLHEETDTGTTTLLRSCMTCRPLAREVLGRCLDLEQRERAVCWAHRISDKPSLEAEKRWQEYEANDRHPMRIFYPEDCVGEPRDSWPFATFGEFLYATWPKESGSFSTWHDLRQLRNDLAHGHYLSWQTITKLAEIEAKLDP